MGWTVSTCKVVKRTLVLLVGKFALVVVTSCFWLVNDLGGTSLGLGMV